jgi:hypothetical protein
MIRLPHEAADGLRIPSDLLLRKPQIADFGHSGPIICTQAEDELASAFNAVLASNPHRPVANRVSMLDRDVKAVDCAKTVRRSKPSAMQQA